MKNIHKIYTGIAIIGFLVIASAVYAQTTTNVGLFGHNGKSSTNHPIVGVVTAISGSSLSVTIQASTTAAMTTYTVNTSGARVIKSGTSSNVSSIQINDQVMVMGIISGTNITARVIIDGVIPHTTGPPTWKNDGHTGSNFGRSFASSTHAINQTFVRPTAIGSVTAITSNSSFTIAERTKTGTTTIIIDTNSFTAFREGTTTALFSNIAVGNLVAVTGTGTNEILASKVVIMPKISIGKRFANHFTGSLNSNSMMGHSLRGFASTTPQ